MEKSFNAKLLLDEDYAMFKPNEIVFEPFSSSDGAIFQAFM